MVDALGVIAIVVVALKLKVFIVRAVLRMRLRDIIGVELKR